MGLLVCDEAHRLKAGSDSKTMAALSACPARARLLLTGTPVQNDLNEFFSLVCICVYWRVNACPLHPYAPRACFPLTHFFPPHCTSTPHTTRTHTQRTKQADFCNPGCFGKSSTFKAQYANPIQKGRDPRASQTQQEFGQLRSRELMSVAKVSQGKQGKEIKKRKIE